MSETLDPVPLFEELARQVPKDLLPNLLVVGSLAAAYHFRNALAGKGGNTKDADLVIQPAGAVDECREIAHRLLDAGWRPHADCTPSSPETPPEELWAIRLLPPDVDFYFIELLGLPKPGQARPMIWEPVEVQGGWYGLPTFRYMGLVGHASHQADEGVAYAAPRMMALANLLSHPALGTETMTKPIGDRIIKRSSKDLGRVLGLAWLRILA